MARPLNRGNGRSARRIAVASLGALLAMWSTSFAGPARASAAQTCAQIAAAEPQSGHTMPPQANLLFASDFPVLTDCEWGYPLGGWGGSTTVKTLTHTPVVFVHGNQADAENWYLVADQFKASAGYTDQEMYAISYNGLENEAAGMPTCCQPSPESLAYWQCGNTPACPSPPDWEICCNGGHGSSNDPNTLDLYNFIRAIQAYTGSQQIDIVAHSLGVTITRKLLFEHPELRRDVLAAVMIAGANHGTTVCRGIESSFYGCNEISPLEALPPGQTMTGSTSMSNGWLYDLNAGGETPGPTRWMSIYDGTDNVDPFFQTGGAFDDRQSPHMAGADYNIACPQTYHNDLRVRPDIVQTYLDFLLRDGQSAALASANPPEVQVSSMCSVVDSAPTGVPESAGTVLLLAVAGFPIAAALWLTGRRRAPRRT